MLAVIGALVGTPVARAQTTWYVDVVVCPSSGSGIEGDPFCKIQDGIDAADDQDEVLVLPGVYNEAIIFDDKDVSLIGRDGLGATLLNGAGLNESIMTCVGRAARRSSPARWE